MRTDFQMDAKFKIAFPVAFLYNKANEKYAFDRKENACRKKMY